LKLIEKVKKMGVMSREINIGDVYNSQLRIKDE
jgi:hypothetical protein